MRSAYTPVFFVSVPRNSHSGISCSFCIILFEVKGSVQGTDITFATNSQVLMHTRRGCAQKLGTEAEHRSKHRSKTVCRPVTEAVFIQTGLGLGRAGYFLIMYIVSVPYFLGKLRSKLCMFHLCFHFLYFLFISHTYMFIHVLHIHNMKF